jgi:hypothetical protein
MQFKLIVYKSYYLTRSQKDFVSVSASVLRLRLRFLLVATSWIFLRDFMTWLHGVTSLAWQMCENAETENVYHIPYKTIRCKILFTFSQDQNENEGYKDLLLEDHPLFIEDPFRISIFVSYFEYSNFTWKEKRMEIYGSDIRGGSSMKGGSLNGWKLAIVWVCFLPPSHYLRGRLDWKRGSPPSSFWPYATGR